MRFLTVAVLLAWPQSAWTADWEVIDADPAAVARIEIPQPNRSSQPAFLEIGCLRGTHEGAYSLRAELLLSRVVSGLPAETRRRVRRLGRNCPGPVDEPAQEVTSTPIKLRVAGEVIETRASGAAAFLLDPVPLESRTEGPCEIATYAVDRDEARLGIEGRGETRTGYLVELLMAEHRGEVTLEAPERGAAQSFPVAGAAAALVRMRGLCGW